MHRSTKSASRSARRPSFASVYPSYATSPANGGFVTTTSASPSFCPPSRWRLSARAIRRGSSPLAAAMSRATRTARPSTLTPQVCTRAWARACTRKPPEPHAGFDDLLATSEGERAHDPIDDVARREKLPLVPLAHARHELLEDGVEPFGVPVERCAPEKRTHGSKHVVGDVERSGRVQPGPAPRRDAKPLRDCRAPPLLQLCPSQPRRDERKNQLELRPLRSTRGRFSSILATTLRWLPRTL